MEKDLNSKPAVNGRKAAKKVKGPAIGLTVKRFFTTPGVDPVATCGSPEMRSRRRCLKAG